MPLKQFMQSHSAPSQKQYSLLGWILVLGTVFLYLPTLFFQFIYYDDNEYVFENTHVLAGLTPSFLKWVGTAHVSANWHPLTLFSHAFDAQLFGLWPGGHHLTSVIFHALNALLVFLLFVRMTGCTKKAFFLAALFAWHPAKAESVAWISERKDVLSTFFALLSMMAYAAYAKATEKKMRGLILCAAGFVLSLLCKPMYVTLPIIFLLFDFWPLERKEKWLSLLLEKIPFAVFSGISCVITLKVQAAGGAIHHFADYPPLIRAANMAQAYWDYIFLFVWPAKLSIFYPYVPNAHILLSLSLGMVLAFITVILFLQRKSAPALWIGWCLFVITLLPVIGIVTVGAHWIACRYLYWPATGLSILFIWGAERLFQKINLSQNITRLLASGILAACLIETSVYLPVWQNSYKLFYHAMDAVPNNWVAHVSLRAAYGRDGNHEKAAEHLIEAIKIFPRITDRIPMHWLDFYYMGLVHWHKKQIPQAASYLREAARLLAKKNPKTLNPDSKPERDKLAACLKALDLNRPENCPL